MSESNLFTVENIKNNNQICQKYIQLYKSLLVFRNANLYFEQFSKEIVFDMVQLKQIINSTVLINEKEYEKKYNDYLLKYKRLKLFDMLYIF